MLQRYVLYLWNRWLGPEEVAALDVGAWPGQHLHIVSALFQHKELTQPAHGSQCVAELQAQRNCQ